MIVSTEDCHESFEAASTSIIIIEFLKIGFYWALLRNYMKERTCQYLWLTWASSFVCKRGFLFVSGIVDDITAAIIERNAKRKFKKLLWSKNVIKYLLTDHQYR